MVASVGSKGNAYLGTAYLAGFEVVICKTQTQISTHERGKVTDHLSHLVADCRFDRQTDKSQHHAERGMPVWVRAMGFVGEFQGAQVCAMVCWQVHDSRRGRSCKRVTWMWLRCRP